MADEKKNQGAPPGPGPGPDTPITVLQTEAKAALVSWFEERVERRCILPAELATGPTLPRSLLKQGAPYGIPWAEILTVNLTPADLELALHAAGLWTLADVMARPNAALSALQSAAGIDLGSLLEKAAAYSAKREV